MGFLRPDPPPLRDTVVKSIQALKTQRNKLEMATYRLRERDKILFQSCMTALKAENKEKAAICANEVAEVRKLVGFLYSVELAIERVILRLETIKELNDIVFDLKPALKMLQGVSQQLFAVLPDVSSELNKVNEEINETLYATKVNADESMIPVNKKTPGGEEILQEVSNYLEQKLVETLPEPPATMTIREPEKVPVKEMVALAANCSQTIGQETVDESDGNSSQTLFSYKKAEISEISLKIENPQLEDVLLEYVRKSKGEIDIARCSVDLDTSYEDVVKALENLGAQGKIKIELRTET